jgi:hypothetical protein
MTLRIAKFTTMLQNVPEHYGYALYFVEINIRV